MQRSRGRRFMLILFVLLAAGVCMGGCLQVPGISGNHVPSPQPEAVRDTGYLEPDPVQEMHPEETKSLVPSPTQSLPSPTSNVRDWNPYTVLPMPDPPLNHASILKTDTPNVRNPLNLTYSGSVGLDGSAYGKELNITTGPFSITYTVHPNISSPLDVWAKLTVHDPWQNPVAEGGYNRGYPNQETQTMTVYREGRYYLTIEGDFMSVDYAIRTGDPAPIVTAPPPPVNEMAEEEFTG